MARNSRNSLTPPESRPTAPRQDGLYSQYGADGQEWDPTAPRKEERYSSPSFSEAGEAADYSSSAFPTGSNPNPDSYYYNTPAPNEGPLDTQAFSSVANAATGAFGGKAPKGERLTRKAKKAAKRELARQKKEAQNRDKAVRQKRKSISTQLKNRDKELSDLLAPARKRRRKSKDVLRYIGYNAMYVDGICEVEEGLFSETIAFEDTSYQSTRDDIQKGIFSSICRLYDQFGADTLVQMSVINPDPGFRDRIQAVFRSYEAGFCKCI